MSNLSMKKPSPRAAIRLAVFALLFVAIVAAETDAGHTAAAAPGAGSYQDAPLIVRWAGLARHVRALTAVDADDKARWH